jgi:hypothetical protein
MSYQNSQEASSMHVCILAMTAFQSGSFNFGEDWNSGNGREGKLSDEIPISFSENQSSPRNCFSSAC